MDLSHDEDLLVELVWRDGAGKVLEFEVIPEVPKRLQCPRDVVIDGDRDERMHFLK